MPIYEYRCESCGQGLEKIQKFSDPPLTDCPACGKAALKKLVSASSFRLKGSGWYETDFKNKKKPVTDAGAEKKDSDSKDGSSSTDKAAAEKTAGSSNNEAKKAAKKTGSD